MSAPRGLSQEEKEAWEKLADTVTPLRPEHGRVGRGRQANAVSAPTAPPSSLPKKSVPKSGVDHGKVAANRKPPAARRTAPPPPSKPGPGLDSHWDRRFKSGNVTPDLTLDLHGHGLDAAYDRLMRGVAQARAMDARTILVVTGKPRPVDPADRGTRRGAIRAKLLDWLAASEHADAVSAIRKAHRHHGGDGALYIVLRKRG